MKVEASILPEKDWVPNNAKLPVLSIAARSRRRIAKLPRRRSKTRSNTMAGHRNGAAESMIISTITPPLMRCSASAAGSATLTLGGPGGKDVRVQASDALILPTGTGHRSIEASEDFLAVGAYPEGQDWDIRPEEPQPPMRACGCATCRSRRPIRSRASRGD